MDYRSQTIKLLKENIQKNLHNIYLGSGFLDMTPETQTTNVRIDQWDYIKLKSFCAAKETINRVKRQPTEWEKIFAHHISVKGLYSKQIKKFTIQYQKSKQPNPKMSKRPKQTFLQRRYTDCQ